MATFIKIADFVKNLAYGEFDFETDQLKIALSNVDPDTETPNPKTSGNGTLSNVTEIAYTNLSSRDINTASATESGGTFTLTLDDLTLTSTGGSTGPFNFIYIYDDTSASDFLIGVYKYSESGSLTLNDGESLNVDFSNLNRLFSIT